MDKNKILELAYFYRKDIVFVMNTSGYISENGNNLIYNTYLRTPLISLKLNESAKLIYLSFDGKRTLVEAFEKSFEYFEGISKDLYLPQFLSTVHMLEKRGVLRSTKDIERNKVIEEHQKETFITRYNEIFGKLL